MGGGRATDRIPAPRPHLEADDVDQMVGQHARDVCQGARSVGDSQADRSPYWLWAQCHASNVGNGRFRLVARACRPGYGHEGLVAD